MRVTGDPEVVAVDGRVIGSRAKATRLRLLDAAATLLERRGVIELTVADIARYIGASPATYYQYFSDVDAVILALAAQADEQQLPLVTHLQPGWSEPRDITRARAFVDDYSNHWKVHRVVLRVRNIKADDGDAAFCRSRRRAYGRVLPLMSDMVVTGQRAGRISQTLNPYVTSAAMLAMIERLLTYETTLQERTGQADAVRSTAAAVLFQTLSGIPA